MAVPGRDHSAGSATVAGTNQRRQLDLNPIFRAGILAVTSNPLVSRAVRNYGMRLGASRFVAEYKADLDRIAVEGLQTNIALKLTHLGLDLDPELAYRNVAELVAHAATHGNFVRIDMEESARVDDTLRIYRRLRGDGHDNVGTVLQSYLYRQICAW